MEKSIEKNIRYESFKDDKIMKLLKEKDTLLKEGQKLYKDIQKNNNQIQKIKHKTILLVDVYTKKMLKEFEIPISVDIDDKEIKVQILNQVEAYKTTLREQDEKSNKDNSTDK